MTSVLQVLNRPKTSILNGVDGAQVVIDLSTNRPRPRPKYTSGDVTFAATDLGRSFISTDSSPVNFYLPADLPPGVFHVFQGGTGQITFVATEGAAIKDGQLRSAGQYTDMGKMVRIESFGDDTYVISGDIVTGLLEWSIVGQTTVEEGDSAIYVIYRPDSMSQYTGGVKIRVTGSNFDTSGFDSTLEQALTNLATLDPYVDFDGVDQLTIYPGAVNPLPLHFFAQQQYTALGDRDVIITISDAEHGEISFAAGSVTTEIINTSRPIDPIELFADIPVVVGTAALSGASQIILADASDVEIYSTVHHANIPALTYVTAKTDNTITLSANTTGALAKDTALTVKPAGWFVDMTTSTHMTLDGSNRCSQLTDSVHGFPFTQATQANQLTYDATNLNGHGALVSNGSRFLRTTSPAVAKLADAASSRFTMMVVGKLNSYAGSTVNWIDGPIGMQAHQTTGAFMATQTSNGLLEVGSTESVGEPYIWRYENDGTADGAQVHCNNQRNRVPMTLTEQANSGQRVIKVNDTSNIRVGMTLISEPFGGFKSTVPSTVGINNGSQVLVTSVDSATQITVNQNLLENLLINQPIYGYSAIGFNRPVWTAKTTANFTIGATKTTSVGVNAAFYYVLFIPKILTPQQKRGLELFFSNRLSTTHTTTTTASAAAGDKKLTLASLTNVHMYQTISGTNIKTGSTIVKIKTSTNEIWLDEAIQGSVSNGATITFNHMGIKIPDQIDASEMIPLYREDYVNGPTLANSGRGQRPYSGDPNSPGTFNGAYAAFGHGSSNNGTAQKNFDLDVLNWDPWKRYTPFSQYKDDTAAKGGLKITSIPTPAELVGKIGYDAVQGLQYTRLAGYLRDAGAFNFQYGYCEGRMKFDDIVGMWGAFWLLATHGGYPPEIDIVEVYGFSPASTQMTIHGCKTFTPNVDFAQEATGNNGELFTDLSQHYATFGVDITPQKIDFYINREKVWSVTMQWDFHCPWYIIVDMAISSSQGGRTPDTTSIIDMFVDYLAVWRHPDPVVTPTGSTQTETTALVTAMSVAPSGGRQTLINTVIEKLKLTPSSLGETLWDVIDFLVVCWAHDAQAARINWKDPSVIGTVVGSPTFTVDRGYAGTLNTAYVDMGITLASQAGYDLNSTLNQLSLGCYADTITRTDAIAAGTTRCKMNPRSGNVLGFSLWSSADRTSATASTGGHYMASRNHVQYVQYHQGGFANGGLGTGKASTGNNTRTTDSDHLKIANGTSRVGYAVGGDYMSPDDVRLFTAIMDEFGRAVGAIT